MSVPQGKHLLDLSSHTEKQRDDFQGPMNNAEFI